MNAMAEALPDLPQKPAPNTCEQSQRLISVSDLADRIQSMKSSERDKIFLRTILPFLEKQHAKYIGRKSDFLVKRLQALKETFKLTDVEVEIILFCFLREMSPALSGCLEEYNPKTILSLDSFVQFEKFGYILLGRSRRDINNAFARGFLTDLGFFDTDRGINDFNLSKWCLAYLSGNTDGRVENEFFTRSSRSELESSDFGVDITELNLIQELLTHNKECNILLYGSPGTGKTSFAKALATDRGKDLLMVNIPQDDNQKQRLAYIKATVSLNSDNSIILIDEADELLNSSDFFLADSRTNKSWLNNFLDTHKKKIIWITNRTEGIDISTMRRFSFSVEFTKLTFRQKIKVLRYELQKKRLEKYFSDDELQALCREYSVDASGIVHAIEMVRTRSSRKKTEILEKVRTMLKGHEKVTGDRSGKKLKPRSFDEYCLDGLNVSLNPAGIITAAKTFLGQNNSSPLGKLSILLHGVPGSGKTEFVMYLGKELNKEVRLVRASDIQSKWIGETEKNIAASFRESGENGTILFFDEADTFLFPRSAAEHSWEKSFTNEILAQLDNFSGIVIFATNDIEGLDHAAIRKFRFKVEFRPLTADGNQLFYDHMLRSLTIPSEIMTTEEVEKVRALKNLTPGDFSVVKEQFALISGNRITHGEIINSLMNETSHKSKSKAIVGFGGSRS